MRPARVAMRHPPEGPARGRLSQRTAERLIWTAFAAGLVLAALLVARSQVGGDQLNLLARGWLLAARRQMVWFGNPMSTGGKAPGGVTSLLVGLPLLLWRDHRAPPRRSWPCATWRHSWLSTPPWPASSRRARALRSSSS